MDFNKIPHVNLTPEQKQFCLEALGKCNLLLQKWVSYYSPKKFRWFCQSVFNGDQNPNNQIPQEKLAEFHEDLKTIYFVRQAHDFLDNRSIEDSLVQNFSRLTIQQANKWSVQSNTLEMEDYLQEAYIALYYAIYSWKPNSADISTYIYTTIKNRFSNVCNHQDNMFCAISADDMNLVARYKKYIRTLKSYMCFDSIAQEMNLTEQETKRLLCTLKKVQIEVNVYDNDVEYVSNHVKFEDNLYDSNDYVNHTFDEANLTELERELILLAMEDHAGWQAEYARTHVSPRTNKPYSRARIGQILESARQKVASVLQPKVA